VKKNLGEDEVLEALQRDLEAARYAAQRAQRQFDAANPEIVWSLKSWSGDRTQALERMREIEFRIAAQQHGNAQP